MKKFLSISLCLLILLSNCLAVTEAEVQEVVNEQGKEVVAGNLFIWFLCAIAFLKISQKIDNIMNTLGLNVGRTGSSLIGETMIVARTMFGGTKLLSKAGTSAGMKFTASSKLGAMSRSLGFIEKHFGTSVANDLVSSEASNSLSGFGGKMYSSSLGVPGGFASKVIGSIAHGKISENGSIKGDKAVEAFSSYFPQSSMNIANSSSVSLNASSGDTINADEVFENSPVYTDLEIGGGRVSGYENLGEGSKEFVMYSSEKYLKPEGEYESVTSNDGALWYKQYAEPTIKKIPLAEEDGRVKYREEIEHKLPKTPSIIDKA